MRLWKCILPVLASTLCFAVQPDRISGALNSAQVVPLSGNVHGLAKAEFDQGRADSGLILHGLALNFKPSATQQVALATLLAQQKTPSSPNFHKWLTPAQFADRFGLSQGDINKVVSWLQAQGFTVTRIANSRNQIVFDGTVAQVENSFHTEIHNYLIDGEVHFANSSAPSVPVELAGIALGLQHLHNFQPKARAKFHTVPATGANPNFTSVVSGNHFVAPGDFATIYDVTPLYTAGTDGTGEKIVLTGQSSIALTDVANFRSASGLAANVPTLLLEPGTGTSTRCSGDEGESDLDVEWSGAVAKNASITLVYAGLETGDTCSNRQFGAFDALQYAIDNNLAPVISNSYGNCESAVGLAFAQTLQGWVQQANTQGQTVMSASGDDGAADCDFQVTTATQGLAVDVPAAVPEVTGMGGNEFNGDAGGVVSGGNVGATQYWSGTTGGADAISSALSYIPEMGWNDTTFNLANGGTIGASGGGASIYFAKPTWQIGTGVPADGKRDVPDMSMNASPDHDGYLFCSEDGGSSGIVASCTDGFRDGAGGTLTVVGGTSAAAPTFGGIVALIDEYLASSGLGNINPILYGLVATNASAFHDITVGNNIVPCTSGTTGCPATAPFQYGFTTNTGYDQVTGLGSVDANALAVAWKASLTAANFTVQTTVGLSPSSVPAGQSAVATLQITPVNDSTQTINFSSTSCTGLVGASCTFSPTSVTLDGSNSQTVQVTVLTTANMTLPSGAAPITVSGTASGAGGSTHTATVTLTVTATNQAFTLAAPTTNFSVAPGGTASVTLTVAGMGSPIAFSPATLPLTFTCTGLPSETTGSFSPGTGTCSGGSSISTTSGITLNIVTTAPVSKLQSPFGHASRIFYALLLPGVFGIVLAAGARPRGARMLGLIVVLGLSTMWLGSCGGSSSSTQNNPGTAPGTYSVVVTAATAGPTALTSNALTITVTVQ